MHLVTGAAGCEITTAKPDYVMSRSEEYSYTKLKAGKKQLQLQQASAIDARVMDQFVIRKR